MLKRLFRRVGHLLHRGELEREMDEEMAFHLEMEVEDRVRAGMSRAEARRTALRDFGGVERFKDEAREARGVGWVEDLGQDVRFSLRTLRGNPGFALVAILTLALGIGANTAIFSVVYDLLLRPLPYPEPDRLVTLAEVGEQGNGMRLAEANFLDWQDMSRSFEAMAMHSTSDFGGASTVLGANTAVRANIAGVSRGFFRVMGVSPGRGRAFAAEEARPGGRPVAVVSHSFWANHLGEDPGVLSRTLDFWGERYEVVGVMPAGFDYPGVTDVWVPLERFGPPGPSRSSHNWAGVARLRDGVELEAARSELSRITAALKERYGEDMDAVDARLTRLQDELVGDLRRPLLLLLGASALVLLVACTNLASTLLARGTAREREVAIRAAVGAGRLRLVRQLLTESLVLAVLGAAAGLGLAALLLRLVLAWGPASLAATGGVGLDGWTLGFTLALSLATTLVFGLLPALRTSDVGVGSILRSGTRGSAGTHRRGLWGALVGAEVALAILLLVGSGLLIRSFYEVLTVSMGFDPERVLTVEVSLPESRYRTDAQIAGYYRRLLAEMEGMPGVEEAGLIQHLPLGGFGYNGSFEVEGRGEDSGSGYYRIVSGDYFPAMGIPLVRGRLFDEGDRAGVPDVAIVNEQLAERLWPGEDPIGRRIRNLANDSWIYPDRWLTVVGVVGDVRPRELTGGAVPEVYVHYLQRPARAQGAVVTLRTSVPPATLIDAARSRVRRLDPDVPVELATMSARVVRSVADRRFTVLLMTGFAAVALLLAAVGVYGVVSYSVARRTREIGIRIALGARPRSVRAMVQRNAMGVVLAGVAVGVAAALLLSRLLQGLLYEVHPTDPLTFAAVVLVLTGVAWLASYIPARRTTRVDPLTAMRAE